METNPPETPAPDASPRPRVNWRLFVACLFGPAVLALIGGLIKVDFVAVASPLVGGVIGGMICGIMLGRGFGKTRLEKVVLGVSCAVVFGCLSMFIGFVGCASGKTGIR